jgi:quercetin dioxygenase-like cupin family protein
MLGTIFYQVAQGEPGRVIVALRAGRRHQTRRRSMQITRNSLDTAAGPEDWFTGSVYVDAVATPSVRSRLSASSVHFTPGARTAWHTHPNGQTIWVLEGVGLCQRRGGPIEVIRPGDRVFFEPGEEHWHGAAPNRFMAHLAMLEVDDGGRAAAWGDHVSDEEYGAAPPIGD